VASAQAAQELGDVASAISFTRNAYEAIEGSEAVAIMTEWNEFRGLDLQRVRSLMKAPVIIDARNVLDPAQTRALGFAYYCTGRERVGALEVAGVV
jgi:UDPglucose 6-dehydrogenase